MSYPNKKEKAKRFMATGREVYEVNETIDQFTKELKKRTELEKLADILYNKICEDGVTLLLPKGYSEREYLKKLAQKLSGYILEGLGDK